MSSLPWRLFGVRCCGRGLVGVLLLAVGLAGAASAQGADDASATRSVKAAAGWQPRTVTARRAGGVV
ncbi:MAG: hypothetical protein QM679_12370, partial [Patulibacter sp.]